MYIFIKHKTNDMKKLFTLALTLFILNAAFSQTVMSRLSVQTPNFGVSYDRNYNNGYYNNSYGDERSYRIAHVNDIYEKKVHEVMCLPIAPGRKVELIRELEWEKADKIRHINVISYNNGYNKNGYYDNDEYRR